MKNMSASHDKADGASTNSFESESSPSCDKIVKPQYIVSEQPNKRSGCAIFIAITFIIILLIVCIDQYVKYTSRLDMEKRMAIEKAAQYEEAKKVFIANIDSKYKELLIRYKKKEIYNAKSIINDFKTYGKMDYRDVLAIEKKVSLQEVKIEAKRANSYEESCYQLGYRYGKCGARSLRGLSCSPQDDIVIPERCRGMSETREGINAGARGAL